MILDFRNGDPALLVGYRGAPARDHAWGCPWQHTVASNQAVTLQFSADFSPVKDKNFSFLGLYSGSSPATFASSQTQLSLET